MSKKIYVSRRDAKYERNIKKESVFNKDKGR